MTDFHFDERAKDWDADPMKVARARAVADAIRAALPPGPGRHALEYGCGTGLLSFALRPDLGQIVLADTSPGMLDALAGKIAATGAADMHPLRLDLAADPLPAERFDLVYSLMTLHHVPGTQTLLLRFHDILEPGGFLALADLDKEDGSFHGPDVTDVHRGFERAELQALAEAAGFGEVRFSTVYRVRKKVDGVARDFPLFLMIAQKGNL